MQVRVTSSNFVVDLCVNLGARILDGKRENDFWLDLWCLWSQFLHFFIFLNQSHQQSSFKFLSPITISSINFFPKFLLVSYPINNISKVFLPLSYPHLHYISLTILTIVSTIFHLSFSTKFPYENSKFLNPLTQPPNTFNQFEYSY